MDNNQQNNTTIKDSLMNMFGTTDPSQATPPVAPNMPPPSTPQPPPVVPPADPVVPPAPTVPVEPPAMPPPAPPSPEPTPAPEPPTPVVPPVPTEPPVVPPPAETTQAVNNLPQDMQDSILDKTLKRVAEVMTEADLIEFEKIDKEDPSGNASKYFLMTRVPKFEEILKEELKIAQADHQASQGSLSS